MKHWFCVSDLGGFSLCGARAKLNETVCQKHKVTCPECKRMLTEQERDREVK